MKSSKDRILTTHAGSLVRPPEIIEVMIARELDRQFDSAAYEGDLRRGVVEVVGHQSMSSATANSVRTAGSSMSRSGSTDLSRCREIRSAMKGAGRSRSALVISTASI